MKYQVRELPLHKRDAPVQSEVSVIAFSELDREILGTMNESDAYELILPRILPGDTVEFIYPRRTIVCPYEQFIQDMRDIRRFDGKPLEAKLQ